MSAPGPYWASEDGDVVLHLGDCLDVLPGLPDCSVDAVVCDPPYGLAELSAAVVLKAIAAWMAGDRTHVPDGRGFMGREWDRFVPPPGVWDECLRVLKPGGHLLAFAGSRTVDLMTLSIRIAGFEIRDGIDWVYGQGFPKSLDVSKAIDKAAGAQREVVGVGPDSYDRSASSWQAEGGAPHGMVGRAEGPRLITAPATGEAAQWEGWGTALKPAKEPIVVARKPLAGPVAANVLAYGTGAIHIDACKVGAERRVNNAGGPSSLQRVSRVEAGYRPTVEKCQGEASETTGRWPPNVVLSHTPECVPAGLREVRSDGHHPASRGPGGLSTSGHGGQGGLAERKSGTEVVEAWNCAPGCPVAEMDAQSGVTKSSGGKGAASQRTALGGDVYGQYSHAALGQNAGGLGDVGGASRFFPAFRYEAKAPASERPRGDDGTAHETVKPLDLMRWLVRLVTPPDGVVLDCFAGSGTTGEACVVEGFRCILVEREERYAKLIRKRLSKPIQPVMFGLEAG